MHKNRLAKNVVRLALAQEFTRAPIKRQNISSKGTRSHVCVDIATRRVLTPQLALGSANSRQFKEIFSMAQNDLRHIFGMEMVELPVREKTKLAARRNAQNADKAPNSSNSYILTSVLPPQFMVPEIVQLRGEGEKSYTGLVTFITALIYLNGRALPAVKLDRYMRTLNANEYTPCGALDTVLQRMQKHGYIIRIKDNTGEETQYEYHLGPRAKVEIGEDGIKSLIKTVYGDEEVEDLDVKFKRNIGLELKNNFDEEDDDDAEVPAAGDRRKKKAAPKRGRRRNEDEDDE